MSKIAINIKKGSLEQRDQAEDIIVGIDLGTTNSLVAYMGEKGPATVKDINGQNALIPSIIHFTSDGTIEVGIKAKAKLIENPERTIFSIKRMMGKSYQDVEDQVSFLGYRIIDTDKDALVKIEVDGTYYNPIELSAEILKYLKKTIEHHLNKTVSKAVITVPAYFNETQRQATRDAGKLAGLDVLRIVNEPTAASLAYGLNKNKNETIAVYDLGGGTFDITILKIEEGVFEVIATGGDTYLGGDDIDRSIVTFWLELLGLKMSDLTSSDIQSLRILGESAKKKLSTQKNFSQKWKSEKLDLSQTQLENLMKQSISKTLDICQQVLRDAKMSNQDIDHVILVGGSTRIPYLKNQVGQFFEKKVKDDLDPDQVVALGAAIQADILAGNQKDILLLDVTPLSLGIETIGGLMDTVVPRNTKVPAAVGREYTTSKDGQINLKIGIYQGERELVADNRKLGEFILSAIPPMPAGIPKIEIKFVLDADGILKVSASELRSNTVQQISIKSQFGITEEEMAKMLIESINEAESDMDKRSYLEAVNEANGLIDASNKFVKQNETYLESVQLERIEMLRDKLMNSVKSTDKKLIMKAIDELNTYTTPLAQSSLERTINKSISGKSINS